MQQLQQILPNAMSSLANITGVYCHYFIQAQTHAIDVGQESIVYLEKGNKTMPFYFVWIPSVVFLRVIQTYGQ